MPATMPLAAPATPPPTDEQDALERAARRVGSVSNDTVRGARRPVLVVPHRDG